MQFNKQFGNRMVTLSKANKKDLKEYKIQLNTHETETKDRINVLKDSENYYLKVKNSDMKLIGIIRISEIDATAAYVRISIPNKSWELRYGTEAIHQLVKFCIQNKPYSRIYFRKNEIIDRYKRERPSMFVNGNYYIEIA